MGMSSAAQFGLLLWKNWLLQKRRIIVTALQILIPVLIAFVLLVLRMLVKSNFIATPTIWDSFDAITWPENVTLMIPGMQKPMPWQLLYAPNTSMDAKNIAVSATRMLNMIPKGMYAHIYIYMLISDDDLGIYDVARSLTNVEVAAGGLNLLG